MSSLAAILLTPQRRDAFAAESQQLIERHVAHRHGFRGISLKTGLGMLKATRPDLLPKAVTRLLPEFLEALEPLYQECRRDPSCDFSTFLRKREPAATAALLGAADRRVAASTSATVKSYYQRFRGIAAEEIRVAMPTIADTLGRNLREAAAAPLRSGT